MSTHLTKSYNDRRPALRKIASETLAAIDKGYVLNGTAHDLRGKSEDSKRRTRYFSPDSLLATWSTAPIPAHHNHPVKPSEISIVEVSTLDAARYLSANPIDHGKIGILNFASAKKAGGGFLNGAQAQEESIARSSTLYPTLMTSIAQNFYTLHNRDTKEGYYTHAMIYSPGVVVFRDDDGGWREPFEADVLTSPAVNAGVVRKSLMGKLSAAATEERIERVMRERMGRILFLFEKEGAKNIVLGSFGTGVFQNDVEEVARIWADLLAVPGARFSHSFHQVIFAILGRKTFIEFQNAFNARKMHSGPSRH
ncbi:hypothetical protein Hypma_012451 [Hypsizygus marmoreus]|uniref:Microbial-type PARG catalytic domain-containing protein n=1 Tax=Hypsizygus marmoreus TaxID=39966 RepID=A0A369JGV3_HYPMA|nr:hypothetical protein Hypma_012451 [Hypsizygus marmoreus]